MDYRTAPLLFPALCLAAGSLAAFRLPYLSVPLLAALLLLGLACSRRPGLCLAACAGGVLAAMTAHELPGRPGERFDRDRPVAVSARVAGHWHSDDEGWSAPAEIEVLRQGRRVATPALEVLLHLPGSEEPPPF